MARPTAYDTAFALHAGAIRMLRALRRVDIEMGLGTARASALSVIVFSGPIGIGDLAKTEQVRGPTMTRIVDRLVRDGLVVRRRDPADKRNVQVVATPKGTRLMEEGRERRVKLLAKSMEELGEGDLRAVAKTGEVLGSLKL